MNDRFSELIDRIVCFPGGVRFSWFVGTIKDATRYIEDNFDDPTVKSHMKTFVLDAVIERLEKIK